MKLVINLDLKDDKIGLKPVQLSDAHDIFAFASNPNVKRYIGWPLIKTYAESENWVKVLLEKDNANTHAHRSVVDLSTGKIIGTIIIFGADNEANHCEIGYVLGEEYWNKGYGTTFVRHLLQCVFEDLAFDKVYARVCSENTGSQKILQKNGFEKEAELIDYFSIEGVKQNCIFFSKQSVSN